MESLVRDTRKMDNLLPLNVKYLGNKETLEQLLYNPPSTYERLLELIGDFSRIEFNNKEYLDWILASLVFAALNIRAGETSWRRIKEATNLDIITNVSTLFNIVSGVYDYIQLRTTRNGVVYYNAIGVKKSVSLWGYRRDLYRSFSEVIEERYYSENIPIYLQNRVISVSKRFGKYKIILNKVELYKLFPKVGYVIKTKLFPRKVYFSVYLSKNKLIPVNYRRRRVLFFNMREKGARFILGHLKNKCECLDTLYKPGKRSNNTIIALYCED